MCKMSIEIGEIAKLIPTPRLQGSANVLDALDQMDMCEVNIIAVECDQDFVGIFKRADFNKRVTRQNLNPNDTTLYEVMTVSPPTVSPNQTVKQTYEAMLAKKWEHMPVVFAKRLLGIVSINDLGHDVIRAYEDVRAENQMILSYIQSGESYGLSDYLK